MGFVPRKYAPTQAISAVTTTTCSDTAAIEFRRTDGSASIVLAGPGISGWGWGGVRRFHDRRVDLAESDVFELGHQPRHGFTRCRRRQENKSGLIDTRVHYNCDQNMTVRMIC